MKRAKTRFGWKNRIRMFLGFEPKFKITISEIFVYDQDANKIINTKLV